jgi:hypothetical protein
VNDQDILTIATQAAEWLLDRRERLEKYEEDPATLLWLSVGEIDAIIGCFDAVDERVLRDDLIDWIGGSGVAP